MLRTTLVNASRGTPFGRPSKAPKQRPELVRPVDREAVAEACGGLYASSTKLGNHRPLHSLQRWPAAYRALEQELQLRIRHSNADQQQLRTEIRSKLPLLWDCPEASAFTTVELAEHLTGERLAHPDDASPLFVETWTALEARADSKCVTGALAGAAGMG